MKKKKERERESKRDREVEEEEGERGGEREREKKKGRRGDIPTRVMSSLAYLVLSFFLPLEIWNLTNNFSPLNKKDFKF